MPDNGASSSVVRFGDFTLDLATCELRSLTQEVINLQPQPAKVLSLLVRRAGNLVTREELRHEVWGQETFVNFERGLNVCVAQLRAALGDEASAPVYIETHVKRGYRFIAPVEIVCSPAATPEPPDNPATQEIAVPARPWWKRGFAVAAASALAILLACSVLLYHNAISGRSHNIGPIRLAVIPFESLGPGARPDYFIQGLTEEIITDLGRLSPQHLRVIGSDSALRLGEMHARLNQIAKDLDIDYVIEGSVRHSAERVLITVHLIRLKDEEQLWTENYDRAVADIVSIQQDVAERTARALALELLPSQKLALARSSTINTGAYNEFLESEYELKDGTLESFRRAIAHLEKATEIDPAFAAAYAYMARLEIEMLEFGSAARDETCARAFDHAQKATQLDEALPDAHLSRAVVSETCDDTSQRRTETLYEHAVALNPSSSFAHLRYGHFLAQTGKAPEAVREMEIGRRLEPLSMHATMLAAWILATLKRNSDAEVEAKSALRLDPSYPFALFLLGAVQAEQGRFNEAIVSLKAVDEISPGSPAFIYFLGMTYCRAGRYSEAKTTLAKLNLITRQGYVPREYLSGLSRALHER